MAVQRLRKLPVVAPPMDERMTTVNETGGTITLLGRVAIGPGGDERASATRRGRRVELVFAYLAAEHHRLVSHDELADALWPAKLPDTWEAALRGVLTEVRRFLAESGLDPGEVLTTARGGHQLRLPATVTVDLDVARDALAAARSLLAAGSAFAAAERATRASRLASLPFLASHDGEWVDGIRHELETIKARALEVETRAHASAGDLTAAATAAERLVHAEPFNEAAHQLRIRILGQAGDRSGAIKAYEHCRVVLAAELGVDPSDETAAAYRAATQTDASSAGGTAHAPPPGPTVDFDHLTMLVVEDHDFQRRTAMMLLRSLGVQTVTEAGDGAAALTLLEGSSRPDVILCDIDMPGMDGVEFIRHVAKGELAGAVILASALDAKVIQAVKAVGEGYGLQVLGAIEKPLTARRLRELLASYRPWPRTRSSMLHTSDGASSLTALAVRTALADGRITFHVQPGVDVATGQVAAAGAVPRWQDDSNGWVPPELFLPLLEREGLLGQLSQSALEIACTLTRDYAGAGLDIAISVEIAPGSLHDTDFPDRAADLARTLGADTTCVTFDLDERAFRGAPASALGVLTRLRVKGFGVSLDRFGTGHVPIEQLRGVPITEVKLAAVLVTGAAADPQRARALEESIDVGRALDVAIVADGCDSEDELRLLLALGCDRVQGAFIADAMPGDALPAWAAGWDPDRLGVGERG